MDQVPIRGARSRPVCLQVGKWTEPPIDRPGPPHARARSHSRAFARPAILASSGHGALDPHEDTERIFCAPMSACPQGKFVALARVRKGYGTLGLARMCPDGASSPCEQPLPRRGDHDTALHSDKLSSPVVGNLGLFWGCSQQTQRGPGASRRESPAWRRPMKTGHKAMGPQGSLESALGLNGCEQLQLTTSKVSKAQEGGTR